MKKFLALLVAMLMVLSLAACGGDKDGKDDSAPPAEASDSSGASEEGTEEPGEEEPGEDPGEEEPEEEEEEASSVVRADFNLQSVSSFSEDTAFIQFRDDANGKAYSGIIDSAGKLQYYFEGSPASSDRNINGYMYCQQDKTFYVITPKGKVTTYELSDNVSMYFYGDGYVVTQEKKSGFEAVEYIYHFYDDSGKELTAYSNGASSIYNISYVGEGTFVLKDGSIKNDAVNSYGYYSECGSLYFAKSDTWHKSVVLTSTGNAFKNYSYQDGIFMIRGARQDSYNNTHPGEFTYVDNQGAVQTLTVPADYGNAPYYLGCSDGIMLFWNNESRNLKVYRYDLKEKSWAVYEGKYTEQMYDIGYSVTGGGYSAICLRGADNKYYTTLLDKSMKDLLDSPVLGTPKRIQDGVLYTQDSGTLYCYDMKGTQLGEFSNVDGNTNWFAEGIIVTNQREFLKPDGTAAFEINYSSGKEVTLPE